MNIKNIENNIWTDIKIDLSSVKITTNSKYLIHYAVINGNIEIIKQIMLLDPNNILFINREIFISFFHFLIHITKEKV